MVSFSPSVAAIRQEVQHFATANEGRVENCSQIINLQIACEHRGVRDKCLLSFYLFTIRSAGKASKVNTPPRL